MPQIDQAINRSEDTERCEGGKQPEETATFCVNKASEEWGSGWGG